MLGKVLRVVAAGVQVVLVRDVARGEDAVQGGGADVKAVIIAIAAIEVNLEAGEIGGARQGDGTVAIPKGRIRRSAKDLAENPGARGIRGRAEKFGKLLDQSGAVRGDRSE